MLRRGRPLPGSGRGEGRWPARSGRDGSSRSAAPSPHAFVRLGDGVTRSRVPDGERHFRPGSGQRTSRLDPESGGGSRHDRAADGRRHVEHHDGGVPVTIGAGGREVRAEGCCGVTRVVGGVLVGEQARAVEDVEEGPSEAGPRFWGRSTMRKVGGAGAGLASPLVALGLGRGLARPRAAGLAPRPPQRRPRTAPHVLAGRDPRPHRAAAVAGGSDQDGSGSRYRTWSPL